MATQINSQRKLRNPDIGTSTSEALRFLASAPGMAQRGISTFGNEINPLAIISKILGIGSTYTPGIQGEGQRVGNEIMRQTIVDPFIKGAQAALRKSGESMMSEAIAAEGPQSASLKLQQMEQQKQAQQAQIINPPGVNQLDYQQLINSPTMGASEFNYMQQQSGAIPASGAAAAEFNRLNQALAGRIIPQKENLMTPKVMPSLGPFREASVDSSGNIYQQGIASRILGNILPAFFPGTTTNEAIAQQSALYDIAGKRQELMGEKPLQKGDLQKLAVENQKFIISETIKQSREGLLKPQDLFTKFEQASQSFITQRDAFGRIQASSKDPSAAGDLATIFGYMKLLDPGSTVREGEFSTAQNSTGVPERIRNIYNRVITGQRLSPKQRLDFLNQANNIFKSVESQQKKTSYEFAKLARANNIDPKIFMRDVGLSQEESEESLNQLPSRKQAPEGAKGWDTKKGTWVY